MFGLTRERRIPPFFLILSLLKAQHSLHPVPERLHIHFSRFFFNFLVSIVFFLLVSGRFFLSCSGC